MNRDTEDQLLGRCIAAAQSAAVPASADEADVFRLAARLLQTWHPEMAARLEQSSAGFFARHGRTRRRSFPDLIKDGLVQDLPRFRNLLEKQLNGVKTW